MKRSHLPEGEHGHHHQRSGDELRRRIVSAVEAYWRENDRSLTIREIGALVGQKAPSHILHHVNALVEQGQLRRLRGSRGILPARSTGVRLLGTIAAGLPLDLLDSGPAVHGVIYALQVQGDSMVVDGILDGDYVLIAYGPTVAQGAIAVAVHDSANGGRGETTLKRVYVHEDKVRLQPANPAHPVRVISREEWESEWRPQGAVVGSYRRYPH